MYKIQGLKDITKSFIVTKLLEEATRRTPRQETRASITLQMLVTLLQALDKVCTSNYEVHLFKAAFCLAFLGFLRVCELTSKSLKKHDTRPLRRSDIDIIKVDGQRQVKMTIRQSKTNQLGQSPTLFLLETGVWRVLSLQ